VSTAVFIQMRQYMCVCVCIFSQFPLLQFRSLKKISIVYFAMLNVEMHIISPAMLVYFLGSKGGGAKTIF
jgi:hypothetical protein